MITYELAENICKLCDGQGTNFQNIQKLIQLNVKKTPTQFKKINIRPKQTFLQTRQTDTQQAHEKMFSQSVSSVAQSCLTLCDSMDCSTPGLPVNHQLSEFIQTHVH